MEKVTKILSLIALAMVTFIGGSFLNVDRAYAACTLVAGADGNWYAKDANGQQTGAAISKDAETAKACSGTSGTLKGKMLTFVKILSTLVVVFAVGMIIYGGFKYITSQGDPRQAETAKSQIWYAGVGLFIVIAAFTILQLSMNASGGM